MIFLAFNNMFIIERPEVEFYCMKVLSIYCYVLAPIGILRLVFSLYKDKIPKILTRQLKTIIWGFLAPELILEFVQIFPFHFSSTFFTNQLSMIGFSACLRTFIIYYCAKRIIKLRFLNLKRHTEVSDGALNFLATFKDILEQLSQTTKLEELSHITKNFFFKAFNINNSKTQLVIRNYNIDEFSNTFNSVKKIESSILSNAIIEHLKNDKLFILDEIEFTNFYNHGDKESEKIEFLNQINSELFIPIFQRNNLIAYIMIEKGSRNTLFSKAEYDQIIIFSNYLANVINFLQNRSITSLIKNEKDLKEELYFKHREITQYKESLRSFFKSNQSHKIEVAIFKNRKFNFIHTENGIIPKFINEQKGHPTTKQINKLVKQVLDSHSVKFIFSQDIKGEKTIITAIPLGENNVILISYYPDVSDVVKEQLNTLKDPTNWDYLLYLETTESGKLINKLIPGTTDTILNFKIELLKICLNKKATLLLMPEEDINSIVEIIHEISLREALHTLNLKSPENNFDIAIKLFGINPIFGIKHEEPLLQKLNGIGTLFIKNIHNLSLETQQYLSEFIKYGFFNTYKSSQKIFSDVRIICSTNKNLNTLVQENKFSKELLNELKHAELKMPSLATLSENELNELVDKVTDQNIHEDAFKDILELNSKERDKIIKSGINSINEFKHKVHNLLNQKSKKISVYKDEEFNENSSDDPILIRATKLGKDALKDLDIMKELWKKFKNQNKIATFLGVNRSSVNRRCKEFNLE